MLLVNVQITGVVKIQWACNFFFFTFQCIIKPPTCTEHVGQCVQFFSLDTALRAERIRHWRLECIAIIKLSQGQSLTNRLILSHN